jgi:predicted small secreted protein
MRRLHLATLAVAAVATLLAACDGTTSALGPDGSDLSVRTGGSFTVGAGDSRSLVGRWTRVEGTGGTGSVLVETTFSFLGDGSGSRVTVTRTALGAVIAEDRQPFTWTAGASVLLIRIQGPVGETILHASFVIQSDVTGTTLNLDGQPYRRAS